MSASTLIYLVNRFEEMACSHRTLESAMIAAFGLDWEEVPEYREVAKYVETCMSYDIVSGEWF